MRCQKCNTHNNEYHIYCYYCGAKLGHDGSTESAKEPNQAQKHSSAGTYSELDDLDLLPTTFERIMPKEDIDKEPEPDLKEQNTIENETQIPIIEDEIRMPTDEAHPPKRRSRKTKREDDKSLDILIKVCSIIIVISLLAFAGLIVYDKIIRPRLSPAVDNRANISANYSAVQDTIDGIPVHKIIVETDIGEQVKILDKTVQVEDGVAEVILEDTELIALGGEDTPDGGVKVTLDVVVSAAGAKDREDKVSFEVAPRAAPLNMIHPKTDEYSTEDDTLTLLMEVRPESKVLINGDNFSDLITKEGRLEKTFNLTEEPEQEFEIVVSTGGFDDNIHTIKIIRGEGDPNSAIKIDQKQPIKTSGEWVKITGVTAPDATLEVIDVEIKPDFKIDDKGKFTIFAKTANIGYTLCTLTASTGDGKRSSLDIVLERPTTEAEYTSRAWEFIYDDIIRDPSLHNGRIFLLTGKVVDILSLDGKHTFILDMSADETVKQLVYVEYWGNMKLEEGQNLKIFGNKWGHKDNMPRVLTQFMYKI